MKILTPLLLLMILFFMLSEETTANGFNKSLQAKALLATNWWPQYVNASDDYCTLDEIYCNEAGSVTYISFFMLSQATTNGFNKSLQAKALLATNWWPQYVNASGDHCNWPGIHCNKAGSVIEISMYGNNLEGDLGSLDFSSFPNLVSLRLDECAVEGSIPEQIGFLSDLNFLSLWGNRLTGNLPVSLTNLTRLENLDLSYNNFSGNLPDSFTNLIRLKHLNLFSNSFSGEFPALLTNLTQLEYLDLSNNNFSGNLPGSFTNLIRLKHLYLSSNSFSGDLPVSLTNLIHLTDLSLSRNNFSGNLPVWLTNLTRLESLFLDDNNFSGKLPVSLTNLTHLKYLHLSHNSLVGPIHRNLSKLSSIDFSSNQLFGNLSFQNPCNLQYLNLSTNQMTGAITSLLVCNQLEDLDLSSNNFVGEELTYSDFPELKFLNQSLNKNLTAISPSPSSIQNRQTDLSCNALSEQSTCKAHMRRQKVVHHLIIFLPIIVGLCFLPLVYMCYKNHNSTYKKIQPETKKHGNVCSILNYDGTIAYEDFITATQDFDLKYCIGTGGYGSVYEAKLPSGQTFALKKLHGFEAKQPAFDQSFKNEVQVLTNLRHKNIVKLYGYCLHNKCNFLVYEYMEKGSLFCALSDSELAVQVDWIKRVNIIKDVAQALAYMHHDCSPPIVHRDISSNNILLNSELEGFVADFGAARLLDPDSSNQTVIAGTVGYIAPGICT
ncbi:putative protein kinase RLK-Pelle-LRR-XI-1 family [Helianthus debilis subsp. tardiflorus]